MVKKGKNLVYSVDDKSPKTLTNRNSSDISNNKEFMMKPTKTWLQYQKVTSSSTWIKIKP